MAEDNTREFYDTQARRYPSLRARPTQAYTDELERQAIAPYLAGRSALLDLGCGEGRLARWMADETRGKGVAVTASDFSPGMVSVAQSFDEGRGISYQVGNAMDLTEADGTYDLIVSATAPNNFPDLDGAFQEIHRVLKPGGLFIGIIINKREMARFARALYFAPFYIGRWIKRTVMGESGIQNHLYSREDLEALAEKNGFDIVELRGMRFIPDWVPEFPLNFFPPLFPVMRWIIQTTRGWDDRLCRSPGTGARARFHFIVIRARK